VADSTPQSCSLGHTPKIPGKFCRAHGSVHEKGLYCERALKRAMAHPKNALFYRTLHGAEAGDLFMSLIHNCELAGANPFDYLTELQRHARELAGNLSAWMPWNYRETLARLTTPAAA